MVGATQVPHAEILEVVKPQLAKEGVELDIKVFSDYVQPNLQLNDKQLDANFFQHKPYLESFNKDRKATLVPVALVHVEPFGGYSKKIKNVSELKDGATIAIPNDPSNGGRALVLLQKQGLVKLKDPSNILATAADVIENPKKLKFRELEAAMLPRSLDDVDLALINTNYALEAGLVPTKDAVHRRLRLALRQRAGDPRRQQGRAGHQEAGQRPAHARGEEVHPGKVQGRRGAGVLSRASFSSQTKETALLSGFSSGGSGSNAVQPAASAFSTVAWNSATSYSPR